jgi:cytochrome c551/c552
MKTKIFFCLFVIILFCGKLYAGPLSADDGKTIFSSQCAGCHNVNIKVVGPALANVDQRHSVDWIINFVHSSQTMVKNNDKDAVAVFNENDQVIMPDHTTMSSDDIKNVLAYIKSETKATPTDEAPFSRPGKLEPNYTPIAITDYGFFGTYITLVITLVGSFLLAVKIKELERENKINRKKETNIS